MQRLFPILMLPLVLAVFSSELKAESPDSFRRQLERQDTNGGTERERSREIPTPEIKVGAPSTRGFFQRGTRIFPPNFQARGDAAAQFEALSEGGRVSENYPVGAGDQFLINFWGRIEDNLIVNVNSDAKLFIPKMGVIDVKGKTYGEVRKAIAGKIEKNLRNVEFSISLYNLRKFNVYALGSIRSPGPVEAQATMRASELIASAGGTARTGSTQFIEIRRGGEFIRVDLLRYLTFGDFSMNPFVTDGDVIFVPDMADFVTVRGAVVRPGTFEILETNRLEDVIEFMGGFSIYADRVAPIRLSRLSENGERFQIQVIAREEHRQNPNQFLLSEVALQNGDEIFVPSAHLLVPTQSNQVFITGEVRAPGPKPYQISTSLEEYIGSAGGLTSRANFSAAVIYKTDGSTVPIGPRVVIEPGDTIFIPEKTFKFWQDHLTIVTTFLSLATSIIVLTSR